MSDIESYDEMPYRKLTPKSEFDKILHTVKGLIKGFQVDGIIQPEEVEELKGWCKKYAHLKKRQPFKELIPYIEEAVSDDQLDAEQIKDIIWYCDSYLKKNSFFDLLTHDIQMLQGMLHGILSDNKITVSELKGLSDWLTASSHLVTTYPYDEISSLVYSVLRDNKIDVKEENLLKLFFSEFVDLKNSSTIDKSEINRLRKEMNIEGICALAPKIVFSDKLFCLTGRSSKTIRRNLANIIEGKGGKYKNSISNRTNYLIVGNDGNPCWTFSCYGRKVAEAKNLRKKGNPIIIANEKDFWNVAEE